MTYTYDGNGNLATVTTPDAHVRGALGACFFGRRQRAACPALGQVLQGHPFDRGLMRPCRSPF